MNQDFLSSYHGQGHSIVSEIITRGQTASCHPKTLDSTCSAHLWSEVLSTTHGIKGSRNLLSDGSVAISTDLMGLSFAKNLSNIWVKRPIIHNGAGNVLEGLPYLLNMVS